jgi:antitoxin component YwqK of YwqJK toxin-antitoxin module
MTRKILLIAFTLITFYGCQNADINDSSKRNENWVYWIDKTNGKAFWVPVKGNETTLKDGIYTRFYKTGTIYQKGKLKNGKDIDTIYFYDLNEKIIQYLIIRPDTLIHYYLKNGPYISYSQNGKIFEKGIIENHQIGDEWTKYFDNGKIDWTKKLVNGTGWNYWYHENGQMSCVNYHVNGKTHGEVKTWYENGQTEEISYWKNGIQHGIYKTYFDNGNQKEISNWVDGKEEGKSEGWFDNGNKNWVNHYKSGIKNGTFENWYNTGIKKDSLNFSNGKVNGKLISYYENGKVKAKGTFLMGEREEMTWYDHSGKLTRKQTFENGQLKTDE